MTETIEPVGLDEDEKQVLAQQPVDQAGTEAVDLVGSGQEPPSTWGRP